MEKKLSKNSRPEPRPNDDAVRRIENERIAEIIRAHIEEGHQFGSIDPELLEKVHNDFDFMVWVSVARVKGEPEPEK